MQKLDCSLTINDISTIVKGVMGDQKYDNTVQIYPDLFIYVFFLLIHLFII